MTLFLLLNSCISREFIYSIDSIHSCHSIFIDDLKVYSESVFADDLWMSRDIAFLPILCVSHDSILAIDLMCRSWIHSRCRFHMLAVTQYSLTISTSTATLFWLTIYGSQVTSFFTISCVSHDSIFAIVLMCQSWIHWRYWFHTSLVTQYLVTISRSTPTKFLLMIYGSAVTSRFWQFHASSMTLFLLSICCVNREFIDAVASIHQLSLSFQWLFQGLQWLSFS
jgi:hypothetical protein